MGADAGGAAPSAVLLAAAALLPWEQGPSAALDVGLGVHGVLGAAEASAVPAAVPAAAAWCAGGLDRAMGAGGTLRGGGSSVGTGSSEGSGERGPSPLLPGTPPVVVLSG